MHVHVKKSRAEEKCYKIESYAVRKEKNQKYERKQFKHDTQRNAKEGGRIKKREKIMRTTFTCTSDILILMPRSALYSLIVFINK